MKFKAFLSYFLTFITLSISESYANHPVDWQLNFQEPATIMMEKLHWFHDKLLVMCFIVSIFVLGLILYACVKFNKKANPVPSKTSHHTLLEVIWTLVPLIILIVIAIPSFKILYQVEKSEKADMTLKVIGRQWYWQYEYPDYNNIAFDSYIVPDKDIKPGMFRLLETDNRVVLPVGKVIKLLITGGDVIHSWGIPAFGVKTDAVPGRINEAWIKITKPGVYYGQCSELCGINHGFMPIAIEAVSPEDFDKWVILAKEKFLAGK